MTNPLHSDERVILATMQPSEGVFVEYIEVKNKYENLKSQLRKELNHYSTIIQRIGDSRATVPALVEFEKGIRAILNKEEAQAEADKAQAEADKAEAEADEAIAQAKETAAAAKKAEAEARQAEAEAEAAAMAKRAAAKRAAANKAAVKAKKGKKVEANAFEPREGDDDVGGGDDNGGDDDDACCLSHIHLADADEVNLTAIPGIGTNAAKYIIAVMKENIHQTWEDLAAHKGIGSAKITNLRSRFILDEDQTEDEAEYEDIPRRASKTPVLQKRPRGRTPTNKETGKPQVWDGVNGVWVNDETEAEDDAALSSRKRKL